MVDRARESRARIHRQIRSHRMKRLAFLLLFGVFFFPVPLNGADTKIQAVATIPDLADMAKNIGGDLIEVTSIATGVEDIHAVPMKPSFVRLLNRADILFLMEIGRAHV